MGPAGRPPGPGAGDPRDALHALRSLVEERRVSVADGSFDRAAPARLDALTRQVLAR